MVPMRFSTIFKSRWMALIWAAGIIWFAYDATGSGTQDVNSSANAAQTTDATGAPISKEQEKQLAEELNGL
ncbi:MAG TPA: hypothetical protein VG434_06265 [Sphingomicrobium sp.]|nr:hypothetical protein [Sphingomicrobium sp.]